MTLPEQVEGAGEGGSERRSLILVESAAVATAALLRASFRLSRGSGLRLAMRAWAMELVSMLCWLGGAVRCW